MKERLSRRRHPAVNFFTGFFAVILSIVLVVTVVATALYSSVTTLITKEKMVQVTQTIINGVVEEINPETLITENDTVKENIEELGLSTEAVTGLLQSDACKEVVEIYTQDMADLLMGKEVTAGLTPEKLKEIVGNNLEEIADIAVEMTGETDKKEELKEMITETFDSQADKLVESLPTPHEVIQPVVESGVLETVQKATSPAILWIAVGVCLLMAALVYLLRYYRFGGLLWIGIDLLLGGLLLIAINAAIGSVFVTGLLNEMAQGLTPVLDATVSVYTTGLSVRMFLVLGLALLCIGGYIALYVTVLKKNPVMAKNAVAQPVETPAAIEEPAVEETTPATETNE